MEEKQPAALSWSVNPWQVNWKRPAAAIAVCVFMALLAGFSFNYPNYHQNPPSQPGPQAAGGAPAGQAAADTAPESGTAPAADNPSHWVGQAITWSLISLLLLVGMTGMIYLPARYKLDEKGVTGYLFGVPTFRTWRHYRNFYMHENGVHLTTMPKPSPLDAFRGHFLQFYGNRDEVVAYIEAHMTLRGIPEGEEPVGDGKREP